MLVISPSEIKVKHNGVVYDLIGTPPLEFTFVYLYYEPETNNLKKVVPLVDQLIYQDLTRNDVMLIQEFLSKLDDEEYLEVFLKRYGKVHDVFKHEEPKIEPPKRLIHAINDKGHYIGMYEDLSEGMTEVPSQPPKDLYLESFGVNYMWDQINRQWKVRGGYKESRKLEYLKNIDIGEQLGALFNAVEALADSKPLPNDFKHISSKIKLIKSSIPKE